MSEIKNKSYTCDKIYEIFIRNCSENKKLIEYPQQFFILDTEFFHSLDTIAQRDLTCIKSLEALNRSCKNYIETTK